MKKFVQISAVLLVAVSALTCEKANQSVDTEVKKAEQVSDVIKHVVFEGASITNGVDVGATLQARFAHHLNAVIPGMELKEGYTPPRVFVGIDYFSPTKFEELVEAEAAPEDLKKAIVKRFDTLVKRAAFDQFYIGIGPAFAMTIAFMSKGFSVEDAAERTAFLREVLTERMGAHQEKVIALDLDALIIDDPTVPTIKSFSAPGKVYGVPDIVVGSHINHIGQAIILNAFISVLNEKNGIELPFMDEAAPIPAGMIKTPESESVALLEGGKMPNGLHVIVLSDPQELLDAELIDCREDLSAEPELGFSQIKRVFKKLVEEEIPMNISVLGKNGGAEVQMDLAAGLNLHWLSEVVFPYDEESGMYSVLGQDHWLGAIMINLGENREDDFRVFYEFELEESEDEDGMDLRIRMFHDPQTENIRAVIAEDHEGYAKKEPCHLSVSAHVKIVKE